MKYIIDTQILIWYFLGNKNLKPKILDILVDPKNVICVSQISLFEIVVKQNVGKLPDLIWDTETIVNQLIDEGFVLLKIRNEHFQKYLSFLKIESHKDPFDRLLISTAITENLPIISADEKFKLYSSEIELITA